MNYSLQFLFLLVVAAAGFLLYRRVNRLRANIALGRPDDRSDQPARRWATMVRVALGQQKMFDRPLVGTMHLVIYVGFVVINLELLEIILDGLLGTHRLFLSALGGFYAAFISIFETLAVGVIVVCVVFMARRYAKGVGAKRLHPDFHREMKGWPALDASLILVFEIVLMALFLTMNGADLALQARQHPLYPETGNFLFSQFLVPLLGNISSDTALIAVERGAWWLHIVGILAFAVYVTYSKHLHILLAFPNTYFARLRERGYMKNMDSVTKEVKIMLGTATEEESAPADADSIPRFGAKDVNDLSWKHLMDAYSCTECGRCTAACPANLTGKKLSPRKIMMDVRDRSEEVGRSLEKGGPGLEDGKSLRDYTTKEELMACTTCNACVEACPILINPLDIILEQRRYIAMEESATPASWNAMFQNMENNFAPWAFAPSDRFNWAEKINQEASEKAQ